MAQKCSVRRDAGTGRAFEIVVCLYSKELYFHLFISQLKDLCIREAKIAYPRSSDLPASQLHREAGGLEGLSLYQQVSGQQQGNNQRHEVLHKVRFPKTVL